MVLETVTNAISQNCGRQLKILKLSIDSTTIDNNFNTLPISETGDFHERGLFRRMLQTSGHKETTIESTGPN